MNNLVKQLLEYVATHVDDDLDTILIARSVNYIEESIDYSAKQQATYVKDMERQRDAVLSRDNRIEELEAALVNLKKFIDLQAEDKGLWCEARWASEAYIQRGLLGCHTMIKQEIAILEVHSTWITGLSRHD